MSAVAMPVTALAHDAQPSVCKRSAWRAWFDLRLNEHTFGLEEPPSAEIGRWRTSETHGCHTASRHTVSPETENCWCKLLLHQDGILRRGNCTANSCRRHNRVVCRPFNLLSLLLFSCVRRCSRRLIRRLIRLNLSLFLFLFHRHSTGNKPVGLLVTAQWLLGLVLNLGLLINNCLRLSRRLSFASCKLRPRIRIRHADTSSTAPRLVSLKTVR